MRASKHPDPGALVTVLTATSAVPRHPSTQMIERAIASLGRMAGLDSCRHLIVCDGYAGTDAKQAATYVEYKRRLRALMVARRLCTRAELIELPQPAGLPGVILAGAAAVRTPYLLVFDHDWIVTRDIDTVAILRTFQRHSDVNYVRLNKHRNQEAGALEIGWDVVLKPDVRARPASLIRTCCWQGTPHFARTRYYRRVVCPHLRVRPEGGALGYEDPLNEHYLSDIMSLGFDRAQRKWGVFIYGRFGDAPAIRHLDGSGRAKPPASAKTRRIARFSFDPNWRQLDGFSDAVSR